MTEKELDSMATVQIKPEYAASEVYSTTSEPPPAYKRQSTSVQIAKIVAFTVITASFVIGAFILASAYLQARASCDQMMALDSVLEKELMLETLQQVNKEIPRAEALIGKEGSNDEGDLQSLDKEEPIKKIEEPKLEKEVLVHENEPETDSSFSDSDETEDLQKTHKVPLELDLSDLAAALLENNQKSRMNCVVERKHAEELVDSPAKTMQLPFGLNLTTDPKKARITGERISIFCESGSEDDKRKEEAEQIPPMFFPIQRLPIPFGPQPQQIPLTHMPQSMPPQPMIHQMPPPFQQIQYRAPVPPQIMQAPRPEPQIRIQVQRIPVSEIHISPNMHQIPIQIPNVNEMPQFHKVPLSFALQRVGITAEDLKNIQRMAEERLSSQFSQSLNHFSHDDSSAESSDSSAEENDSDSHSNEHVTNMQQPPQPQQTLNPPMPEQFLIGRGSYGRIPFGRSLPSPVQLPTPMHQPMQPQEASEESAEPERQHFVHPRSTREASSPSEKRVKRYACDCSC